jgi:cytochrome bd ubiquinol oxidase subunit II
MPMRLDLTTSTLLWERLRSRWLCGIGLSLGYALIGTGWLIRKTEGDLRERTYGQAPWLVAGVFLFLVIAFVFALKLHLQVMERWIERPVLAIFPLIGAWGGGLLLFGLGRKKDNLPFVGALLLFISAYGTLAVSFLPYMIPFTITFTRAAAPHASLAFLFWFAGIIVLPLTLLYNLVVYRVFRGKIVSDTKLY